MSLDQKIIVAKTGGSSNADATMLTHVKGIMDSDPNRRILVVSAPGKSGKHDRKITEMLYTLYFHTLFEQTGVSWEIPKEHRPDAGTDYTPQNDISADDIMTRIIGQYQEIGSAFGLKSKHIDNLTVNLDELIAMVRNERVLNLQTRDLFAMEGELSFAPMIAELLGATLLTPFDLIHYDGKTAGNQVTYQWIKERLNVTDKRYVLAGFAANGSDSGRVPVCLPRGGSDLTGAIVSAGLKRAGYQDITYENWTDSPIKRFNPNDFDKAERDGLPIIRHLRFDEAEELTGSGFAILESSTTGAAREAGVPINVRMTRNPSDPGTYISEKTEDVPIAGVSGLSPIYRVKVFKHGMSNMTGVLGHVSGVIAGLDISIEHIHTGNNYIEAGIRDWQLIGKRPELIAQLQSAVQPDSIDISENWAYLNIVGQGLVNNVGIMSRIYGAVEKAGVNIPATTRADPGMNIVLLVAQQDYRKAIHALRNEFYPVQKIEAK